MSSATVRAAVANYFINSQIPGLNMVHRAPPFWADGSEWDLARNLGSGAIAAVHLTEDTETRATLPALTGQKLVHYRIGLMIFYQWLMPQSLTPQDEADWADPLDVIIDGVKNRIRADPNLGIPSVVFQAGQDADDLMVRRDVPRNLPGKVLSWNVVEFSVYEIITA